MTRMPACGVLPTARRRRPAAVPASGIREGTRNELLGWLDDLDASVGDEHRALVVQVYGESWLKPFREPHTWRDRE
jgi:hypothetical protein